MPETYKKLAQAQPGVAAAALYTVPAGTQALIRHIDVVNTSVVLSCTIKLWHDGSAAANTILPAVELALREFGEFDGIIAMEPGDTLQAQASVAATITVTVHGVEVT